MSTRYLWIKQLQEPYDARSDERGRAMWGFNVLADKAPSSTFLEELVALLTGAGVGAANSVIFWTSQNVLPDGDGPFVKLTQTGGPGARGTHNEIALPAEVQCTAHILTVAADSDAARDLIYQVYSVLVGVRNQSVTPFVV